MVLVAGQTILNASLAVWLYMEYLHNPFMQEYLGNLWSSIWPEVTIAVLVVGAVMMFLLLYLKKHGLAFIDSSVRATAGMGEPAGSLAPIDVCPFCNIPLKVLSQDRFQCRQCRRYFKK